MKTNNKAKTTKNAKKTVAKQLTIVIKGKAYERLEGIAKALNEFGMEDGPFTPQVVWDEFFNEGIAQLEGTDKDPITGCPAVDELIGLIADDVDCTDRKRKVLEKLLKKYVK